MRAAALDASVVAGVCSVITIIPMWGVGWFDKTWPPVEIFFYGLLAGVLVAAVVFLISWTWYFFLKVGEIENLRREEAWEIRQAATAEKPRSPARKAPPKIVPVEPRVFGVKEALLPPTPQPEPIAPAPEPVSSSDTIVFDMERTVLKPAIDGSYPGGTPKNFPFLLHDCYEFFNQALFGGVLAPCIIVVDYLNGEDSSFSFEAAGQASSNHEQKNPMMVQMGKDLVPLQPGDRYDKITLALEYVEKRDFKYNLATFVHEMCHVMQRRFDDDPNPHPPYWADLMRKIDLPPHSTANDGSKELGKQVSDSITPGGVFDRAAQHLIDHWDSPFFPPLKLRSDSD